MSVSLGTPVNFESGAVKSVRICQLSADKFLIAYIDDDDSDRGKCVVGTISGTTITLGSITTFSTKSCYAVDVTEIGDDTAVIAYTNISSATVKAIACTVSGTTPTFGTAATLQTVSISSSGELRVCSPSSGKFCCIYITDNGSWAGYMRAGSVSGTTITLGTQDTIYALGSLNAVAIEKIDTDKVIYHYLISNQYWYFQIRTLTGVELDSPGTANLYLTYSFGLGIYSSISYVEADKVCFSVEISSSGIVSRIITASGTVATVGSSVTIMSQSTDWEANSIQAMSTSDFLCVYEKLTDTAIGLKEATFSGTTISLGTETIIDSDDSNFDRLDICKANTGYFVIAYADTGSSTSGYCVAGVMTGSKSASVSPSVSPSPSIPDTTILQTDYWKVTFGEVPSNSPSISSSVSPSVSLSLSLSPSLSPSASPSVSPSVSISPSVSPSVSKSPSISPSISPSKSPSVSPSVSPSISLSPSISPSISPSVSPSKSPSVSPSASPSLSPSISPSASPSVSLSPSISPSESPSVSPSPSPGWSDADIPTTSWSHPALPSPSWVDEDEPTTDWSDVYGWGEPEP